jgi:hypothetical protein
MRGGELPSRQRNWREHGLGIWLCGLVLPFAVLLIGILSEKLLGIAVPCLPRWAFFSLFAVAILVTTTGCFLSDLPPLAKIALAILTLLLFPCIFVTFAFLLALIFGIEAM